MARSIVVIHAGLGEPSSTALLGQRLAAAASDALTVQGQEAAVTTVALRDHSAAIMAAMTSFPPASLQEVFDAVARADGIIALTPLFNTSYSGLFKSFFDVLPEGTLDGRPVLMGATGGTPRHSLALDYAMRPMFAYLHADVLPTSVFAATADWGAGADHVRPLPERIERAGAEFAAVVAARQPVAPRDQFSGEDFGQMLARLGQ